MRLGRLGQPRKRGIVSTRIHLCSLALLALVGWGVGVPSRIEQVEGTNFLQDGVSLRGEEILWGGLLAESVTLETRGGFS